MKSNLVLSIAAGLLVTPAFAIEKEFIDRVMQHAGNIEKDATLVSGLLKSKQVDATDLRAKLDAMSHDVTQLNELVAQYESSHPTLSPGEQKDWQLLKDKAQLVKIFHERKQDLASQDVARNRSLIRAHANGVALRAQRLQETATRLARAPIR